MQFELDKQAKQAMHVMQDKQAPLAKHTMQATQLHGISKLISQPKQA